MKKFILLDRGVSLAYDFVLIGFTFVIIYYGVQFMKLPHLQTIILTVILIITFYLLEFAIFPLKSKATLGKYLNDLYIESTHGKITFGRLLFREIIMKHLLYLTFVGFIGDLIFFLIKKQTLHDYYLKTKVLKKVTIQPQKEKKERLFGKNN